jgi:hypothetical protein
MNKVTKTGALVAVVLILGSCTSKPMAPGEKPTEDSEVALSYKEASLQLDSNSNCTNRLIQDSVSYKETGEDVVLTWWRTSCGEVQCAGRIESYDKESVDLGRCERNGEVVEFSEKL